MLENIRMTKEQSYPLRFGSLLVYLAMYYLGSLLAKQDVLWESHVLVAQQIYSYLKNLNNCDEICKSFFESFFDAWSVDLVSPSVTTVKEVSSSKKRKLEEIVSTSSYVAKRNKKDLKEKYNSIG